MNGLELSRAYYEEYGRPMLEKGFASLLPLLAVGLVGSGSECWGFDDEVSRDHDFEPGFCIFLPGEDVIDRRTAFLLERAYAKLPGEFMGFSRQRLSPVGGNRHGPIRTADFYLEKAGTPDGIMTAEAWLTVSDHALAEAVNGEVFFDGSGEFTSIRERLSVMPEDVRKKRIAGNLLLMAQSGQYNYARCLAHGEEEAAALACREYVWAAMKVLFLLRGKYLPYYKWSFRALRRLEGAGETAALLSRILIGNVPDRERADLIEEAAGRIIGELRERSMTGAVCDDLEKHAYSVNDSVSDGMIRNLHILSAV